MKKGLSGHRTHNYPKTSQMKAMADSFRPAARPVMESEPVNLPPPRPSRNWFDFTSRPKDIVDTYKMESGSVSGYENVLNNKRKSYLWLKNGGWASNRRRAR